LNRRAAPLRFLGHIGLDGERFPAAFGNFIHHLICAFLCRSVIDDDGRAFRCELLGNSGADALRGAGDNGELAV